MKTNLILFILISFYFKISIGQKEYRTYYDGFRATKIKEKYYINSSGQKNGSYLKYASNGKLIIKATFKNGIANGKQEFYMDMSLNNECSKLPYSIKNFSDGSRTGTWYEYGCKGGKRILKSLEKYEKDKLVYYEKYTDDGVKIEEGRPINGLNITWYSNGQKWIEATMVNGKYSGTVKEWHPDGVLLASGEMKEGTWFGEKKIWYSNGILKSIENYTDGDLYGEVFLGTQKYYDSLGRIKEEFNYSEIEEGKQKYTKKEFNSNGIPTVMLSLIRQKYGHGRGKETLEGEYVKYHQNGEMFFKGSFQQGKEHGLWYEYDSLGMQIDSFEYFEGDRIGEWKIYYDSSWNETDKDNASFLRSLHYAKNGKINFEESVKEYYLTGELKFEGKMMSLNPDIIDGNCTYYYKNGNKEMEGKMLNGVKTGTWTEFHENGMVKRTSTYKQSISDSTISLEDGIWFYFDEKGVKYKKEKYWNGVLIYSKKIKLK